MARPRDTQRAKLYRAERAVPHPAEFKTMDQCQAFIDQVLRSRWVATRWRKTLVALPGKGYSRAVAYPDRGTIQLPLWSRSKLVICHEIAHHLTPSTYAWHGPEYAGVYLMLVKHVIGDEAYDALRASFKANHVRYTLVAVVKARYELETRTEQAAAERAAKTRPPSAYELAEAAEVIRRAARTGRFGTPERKPRIHALATARLLEKL